ncbi:MAG TPA: amine dehydrogenase large subunit [Steroidobacteraceae bacterium]|nr:amine dehydrogenase large subunit [Steroidobacteraceae bacterium]
MSPRTRLAAGVAAVLALVARAAWADLPIEHTGVAQLKPDNGHRLYIVDKFPPAHAIDSRIHVIDGDTFAILGQMSNGSFGSFAISADHKTLFNATTFFSRGDHGARTDVVEYYDTSTLIPRSETLLAPKRAMTNQYSVFLVESAGAKYLLVQNATPATSVSVIDLSTKAVLSEIETAGCFGIYASSKLPGRFATLCGDGTALTVDFDTHGKEVGRRRSSTLFDPDKDALFITGVKMGERTLFISFLGNVHSIDFSGDVAKQDTPWSFIGAADKAARWRPGGYGNIAYSPFNGQLYVGMHPNGVEGSHKTPAEEIWKVDVARHVVTGRVKSDGANYLQVSKEAHPLLFSVNVKEGIQGSVTRYDGDTLKVLGTSKPDLLEGGGPIWVE